MRRDVACTPRKSACFEKETTFAHAACKTRRASLHQERPIIRGAEKCVWRSVPGPVQRSHVRNGVAADVPARRDRAAANRGRWRPRVRPHRACRCRGHWGIRRHSQHHGIEWIYWGGLHWVYWTHRLHWRHWCVPEQVPHLIHVACRRQYGHLSSPA